MTEKTVKATVGAILTRNENILLTKRSVDPFRDFWCIPGGKIEYGEKAMDAVQREVMEETGLKFKPEFMFYMDEIIHSVNWHSLALVFSGQASGKEKTSEEVSEFKWISPREALKVGLAYKHNDMIKEWMRRV